MTYLIPFFIFLYILLTCLYWFTDLWKSPRFAGYTNVVVALGTLSALVSFLLSLKDKEQQSNEQKQKQLEVDKTNFQRETEQYWINIEQMFAKGYPYLASLYNELYPNMNIELPNLTSDQQIEANNAQEHMCQILFQTIENIIVSHNVITVSYGWYAAFLSWSQSPTFQKVWSKSKYFYNPATQDFINNLISKKIDSINALRSYLQIQS
jgi:hypothetical protein